MVKIKDGPLNMEITLKSGKKVNYEKPNFWQRAEIKDLAVEYYKRNIPMSLTVCGKIALHCRVATDIELNDGKYTDEELYEIGATLLNEFYTVELDKKK